MAEIYGNGQLRLTVGQNLIIPNVPDDKISKLTEEPVLKELRYDPSEVMRGLVSCTGMDYCHFALIETKGWALKTARTLTRGSKRSINATFQFAAKLCHAPVFDEKSETRFGAKLARAMIAKDHDDLTTNCGRFVRRHEQIQRRGDPIAARAHLAAHPDVKSFSSLRRQFP